MERDDESPTVGCFASKDKTRRTQRPSDDDVRALAARTPAPTDENISDASEVSRAHRASVPAADQSAVLLVRFKFLAEGRQAVVVVAGESGLPLFFEFV